MVTISLSIRKVNRLNPIWCTLIKVLTKDDSDIHYEAKCLGMLVVEWQHL